MIKIAYKSLLNTLYRLDTEYIIHGGFWLTMSQSVSIVFVLVTSFVFANYVDVADYGVYKYVLSLGVIFSVFSLTGMSQSVTQASARGYLSFIQVGFKKSLLYGLSTTGIGAIAAIYYFLNQNATIAIGCLLIALLVPLINSAQLIHSHLHGLKKFSLTAKLQILKIVITSSVILTTIYFSENILFYIAAYFISNAVISVLIYFYTRTKSHVLATPEEKSNYQKYLSYAKHTSVRDILTGLAYEFDKILAFQLLGATELAIYVFAIAIPEQFKGVVKNLGLLILLKFTGYDMTGIKKDLLKKVLLLGLILLLLTILYVLAAPFIYAILFPNYIESVFLSQVFALSFLSMVYIFPLSALQSQMRERDLHSLNIGTSIILIISLYIGVTLFGLIGLVISRVFTRYVHCLTTFLLLYRKRV